MDMHSKVSDALGAGLTVKMQVDAGNRNVFLPPHLKERGGLVVLEIGLDMPVPIPDLCLTEVGWTGTLHFAGRFLSVFVPWDAVVQVGTSDGAVYRRRPRLVVPLAEVIDLAAYRNRVRPS